MGLRPAKGEPLLRVLEVMNTILHHACGPCLSVLVRYPEWNVLRLAGTVKLSSIADNEFHTGHRRPELRRSM